MITLPAISLWQPWASLLFVPDAKVHETRHWPAPRRLIGRRFLVHAAKTKQGYRDIDPDLHDLCMEVWGCSYNHALPLGAFVGVARLGTPFPMREGVARYGAADDADQLCGDWRQGRFAWPTHEPRAFSEPIPAKGQQGWWQAEIEGEEP